MNFKFTKQKIIILSACAAVILAIFAAFIIIRLTTNDNKNTNKDNNSSSSQVVSNPEIQPVESDITENNESETPPETELHISYPTAKSITVTENKYTIKGTCDKDFPLTLNGKKVDVDKNGIFSVAVDLKEGKNTFTFSHKDKESTYTINYRYKIIDTYNPSGKQSYSSASTLTVTVQARKNSTVTATFNKQTITLSVHNAQDESSNKSDTFVTYIGSFKLPSDNKSDLNLGKITYKAVLNGKSESFSSGNITCKKAEIKVSYNPNAAPLGGKYLNVGTGKIAEIVEYEAETFDAYSTNDWSRPTNNYLPKGTMDYSAQGYVYYESSSNKKEYAILRYGRQVYTSKKDNITKKKKAVIKEYAGTLPDHNEIEIASFKNNGSHTVLTLNTLWKAPFYFDILPQSYSNPSKQDYKVSSVTSKYIDITLCYTTVFKGNISIPKTNPLFSSCKIIKNKSDYTIRLYLRKQGGFYGWDANYNSNGQLVFEFLNPARVKSASNPYGADLTGVTVLLDVGHGGADPGALGFNSKNHSEAIQNLYLAKKIASELKSIGATVYLTRNSDTTTTNDQKIQMLKNLKPDICIAIHHNSNASSSPNGFDSYYSHPFAKKAAELVYMHTKNTGIYKKSNLGWHYYFMARSSYCPVVLTENGFISNSYDYNNIINSTKNSYKAQAIVRGIADYFLYISPDDVPEEPKEDPKPDPNPSKPSSSTSSDDTSSSASTDASSSSSASTDSSSSTDSSDSDNSSDNSSSENSGSQNNSSGADSDDTLPNSG